MMSTHSECRRKWFTLRRPKTPKSPLHFYLGIQTLSTSGWLLGASFPAVPTEAYPPAVMPLPVAPPVAVETSPGFVAMADPDDAFCNTPGVEKSIIYLQYS